MKELTFLTVAALGAALAAGALSVPINLSLGKGPVHGHIQPATERSAMHSSHSSGACALTLATAN